MGCGGGILAVCGFFCDRLPFLDTLRQSRQFSLLVHFPAVSSSAHLGAPAVRCGKGARLPLRIISLSKFREPFLHRFLVKSDLHLIVHRQPSRDHLCIHDHRLLHLICNARFTIPVHLIAGRLEFRGLRCVFRLFVTARLLQVKRRR